MTTTLRRRPRWVFAAVLAAASGCGQPPPMVSMSPPGVGGDPLAIEIEGDDFKAQALGESAGLADTSAEGEAAPETSPPLEPTKPGEEIRLESGLTYSTIEPGSPDGPMAEVGDTITVFYEGKLESGFVFDSNMGDEPIEFRLASGPGGVIKGWVQGINGMRVGERRKLVIPPDLGYGASGLPPDIPPDATLTFEVKLVEIHKAG